MNWYDIFSLFYDRGLASVFEEARQLALEALELKPGEVVLDLPCGTGLSLLGLVEGVTQDGFVCGIDYSAGMLQKAKSKRDEFAWNNVELRQANVLNLKPGDCCARSEKCQFFDAVHCFLGMSVFPNPHVAFSNLLDVLKPNGRFVVVDTYAEKLNMRGWMVNVMARAEIRKKFWKPIQEQVEDVERFELPFDKRHGGKLVLCKGRKSASSKS